MKDLQLNHQHHQPGIAKYPLSILLDNVKHAENVGSLFRIADAFAVERLYLCGETPAPPNKKIRKTSRATEQAVAFERADDATVLVGKLKADGYTVISLEITKNSATIKDLKLPLDTKLCLIVGAENQGVSQPLLDASDICIHIPMLGQNSSINVATACAIAVYQITGQLAPL